MSDDSGKPLGNVKMTKAINFGTVSRELVASVGVRVLFFFTQQDKQMSR